MKNKELKNYIHLLNLIMMIEWHELFKHFQNNQELDYLIFFKEMLILI